MQEKVEGAQRTTEKVSGACKGLAKRFEGTVQKGLGGHTGPQKRVRGARWTTQKGVRGQKGPRKKV